MIAVDTNILVYAHREDSSFHEKAKSCLTTLAQSGLTWTIPWPCLHEFLGIVTHPRIYKTFTPMAEALRVIDSWVQWRTLHFIGETSSHWEALQSLLLQSKMTGPQIHDAKIAAICLQNQVKMLWTADRDFSRVAGLTSINPLIKKDAFST